ncbi:metal-dependent hydrolase [Sorangium sp. So ce385]|uniref:metal-dependent hydrolase n=1 Tax=Sorangium sp. So ce385 TaxID=3133308 RepID=UPI003F5B7BE9
MDTLTHGLLGLAVGATRRPDVRPGEGRASPTDRAVLLSCVIAAELPDLDYFWPAGDAVLRTLRAHRGPSHALLFAPVGAAVAAGVAWLVLRRRARFAPVYAFSVLSVALAHLLPDLWTGWGTRLLLPFSDARLTLDWTGVLDPLVTLPLALGALVAWRRRARWRRAILVGAAVAAAYVGGRIATQQVLVARVAAAHPEARHVAVFPAMLGVTTWRFIATHEDAYAAGTVDLLGGAPTEERRVARAPSGPVPARVAAIPTVREALAWARFPVVRHAPAGDGGTTVRVADLRYHLRGDPTLEFIVDIAPDGAVTRARLERGGSARELLDRWRR